MLYAMAQSSLDSDRLSSAGLSTHSSGTAGTVGGSVVGVRPGDPRQHKRDDEDDYTLGPLPPQWEKAFTPSGEVYFIDHNSGTSHWLDPRLARVRKRSLAEKLSAEDINNGGTSGSPNPEKERFTLTLIKSAQGLGFTLIGGPDVESSEETEGYLQIRSIVPHGPAWMDGALRPGDMLVGVGSRGVRGLTHAQVAQIFQSIPPGTPVLLHFCRGYPLAFDSEDPNTRVLSTLAVDASTAPPNAVAMQQLTHALRTRFNLESPGRAESSPGRDEPDHSPARPPHSPDQRRMLSRSFDLDELGTNNEPHPAPPRCPSADHLLSHTGSGSSAGGGGGVGSEGGRELVLTLRRGAAGFGFTIADSVHGQKVKKVLDRSRCAGLREGDLLLQIGDTDVRHAPHQHVVQVLKECPALHETTLRVWRRAAAITRAPRSRSATRVHATSASAASSQMGRSKTPTAEQLRSPVAPLHAMDPLHNRLNGEATYAVPEHKRESLMDRRRRSSTPGGRLSVPTVAPWTENQPNQNHNRPWSENQQNPNTDRPWSENQPHPNPDRPWTENQQHPNSDRPWNETWLDNANVRNWAENAQTWDENARNWEDNSNSRNWEENGNLDGRRWDGDVQSDRTWGVNGGWGEVGTPTVHVDTASYWRGNASVADSSDNGGFPEDGVLPSPTTAAVGALSPTLNHNNNIHQQNNARLRPHSPSNNSSRIRSNSPSNNSSNDQLLTNSPGRLQSQSPSNNSSNLRGHSPVRMSESSPSRRGESRGRIQSPSCFNCHSGGGTDSPMTQSSQMQGPPTVMYPGSYPQVEAGGSTDPEADVLVRLARGSAGFGFRIVGGTEDGSRVAVGHVVPGGPADGLLRPGDLLTSVDGVPLSGATHARAVAYVCQAASRGHVTLGVRHNRADIQQLGLPPAMTAPHQHHQLLSTEPSMQHMSPTAYNILHPAPLYPPAVHSQMYGAQYEAWGVPYDVVVTRNEGEGFGFVVISSTNKATSTIGQLIPNSPAARCGLLNVGDTILAINHAPIRHLPHPDVVALIKQSGRTVTLTVHPPDRHALD